MFPRVSLRAVLRQWADVEDLLKPLKEGFMLTLYLLFGAASGHRPVSCVDNTHSLIFYTRIDIIVVGAGLYGVWSIVCQWWVIFDCESETLWPPLCVPLMVSVAEALVVSPVIVTWSVQ